MCFNIQKLLHISELNLFSKIMMANRMPSVHNLTTDIFFSGPRFADSSKCPQPPSVLQCTAILRGACNQMGEGGGD